MSTNNKSNNNRSKTTASSLTNNFADMPINGLLSSYQGNQVSRIPLVSNNMYVSQQQMSRTPLNAMQNMNNMDSYRKNGEMPVMSTHQSFGSNNAHINTSESDNKARSFNDYLISPSTEPLQGHSDIQTLLLPPANSFPDGNNLNDQVDYSTSFYNSNAMNPVDTMGNNAGNNNLNVNTFFTLNTSGTYGIQPISQDISNLPHAINTIPNGGVMPVVNQQQPTYSVPMNDMFYKDNGSYPNVFPIPSNSIHSSHNNSNGNQPNMSQDFNTFNPNGIYNSDCAHVNPYNLYTNNIMNQQNSYSNANQSTGNNMIYSHSLSNGRCPIDTSFSPLNAQIYANNSTNEANIPLNGDTLPPPYSTCYQTINNTTNNSLPQNPSYMSLHNNMPPYYSHSFRSLSVQYTIPEAIIDLLKKNTYSKTLTDLFRTSHPMFPEKRNGNNLAKEQFFEFDYKNPIYISGPLPGQSYPKGASIDSIIALYDLNTEGHFQCCGESLSEMSLGVFQNILVYSQTSSCNTTFCFILPITTSVAHHPHHIDIPNDPLCQNMMASIDNQKAVTNSVHSINSSNNMQSISNTPSKIQLIQNTSLPNNGLQTNIQNSHQTTGDMNSPQLSNPSTLSKSPSLYSSTTYQDTTGTHDSNNLNNQNPFVDSYLYRDISWTDNSFYMEHATINRSLSIDKHELLFLTPDGVFNPVGQSFIGNSSIYVVSGRISVYIYHVTRKQISNLSQQIGGNSNSGIKKHDKLFSTYLLDLQPFETYKYDIEQGDTFLLPASYFYIIQAQTSSIVYRRVFFTGSTLKLQIDLFRLLYQEKSFSAYKVLFWELNWLAAVRYLLIFRKKKDWTKSVSHIERSAIPQLICTLKLIHELYVCNNTPNDDMMKIKTIENDIPQYTGCLGPLDLLYELSTISMGNKWTMKTPRIKNQYCLSIRSEETAQAVEDTYSYHQKQKQFYNSSSILLNNNVNMPLQNNRSGHYVSPQSMVYNDYNSRSNSNMNTMRMQSGSSLPTAMNNSNPNMLMNMNSNSNSNYYPSYNMQDNKDINTSLRMNNLEYNNGLLQNPVSNEDENSWEFRCICGKSGHNYDDHNRMVNCPMCHFWSHTLCEKIGDSEEPPQNYICSFCKQKQFLQKTNSRVAMDDNTGYMNKKKKRS